MRIQDFFERIYIINLPHRVDRRERVVSELERIGTPLQPGKVEIFPAIRPDSAEGFASIGLRGCCLSHIAVMRQARNDRLANVLILEDDMVIWRKSWPHAPNLLDQLSKLKWDIAYLGHFEKTQGSQINWLPMSRYMIGLHFYGLNGPVLERLVDYMEQVPTRPIGDPLGSRISPDGAVNIFRELNPDVIALRTNPSLADQGSSPSDLQPPHWYDQTPVLRHLASTYRKIKSAIKHR